MRIGLDVDEVLASLIPAWLCSYNVEHGTKWTQDDLTRYDFQHDLGCSGNELHKHLVPKLYDTVKPCEGALEVVEELRKLGHEPIFISSAHDMETWNAKARWLIDHKFIFPNDIAIPVGEWCQYKDKQSVGKAYSIRVMVDDHVKNVENWPGRGLLLTQPHNLRAIYCGKRLKKFSDLLMEIKYMPEPEALKATSEGWVGGRNKLNEEGFLKLDAQGSAQWGMSPGEQVMKPIPLELLPSGEKPSNPKDIIGSDKMPFHLWPEVATIYGTLGMLEGALKYGRGNFRAVGVRSTIYIDAARRHINAWASGEDNAQDSGLPHLGHALACLAILIEAIAQKNLVDDRDFKGEAYLELLEQMTPEVKRLKEKYKDRTPKHYSKQTVG